MSDCPFCDRIAAGEVDAPSAPCSLQHDASLVVNDGFEYLIKRGYQAAGATEWRAFAVLGRDAWHFDLSADYLNIARWRTTDPGERARAMKVPKPPPVPEGQGDLFSDSEAS